MSRWGPGRPGAAEQSLWEEPRAIQQLLHTDVYGKLQSTVPAQCLWQATYNLQLLHYVYGKLHRCLWQATSCYKLQLSMASYTTAAAQNYGRSHLANRPTLRNLAKCPAHQTTSKPGKCPLPQNLESDLYLKTWKVTCSQNLESSL